MEGVSWGDVLPMEDWTEGGPDTLGWGSGRNWVRQRWGLWESRKRGCVAWVSRGTSSTWGCIGSKE